MKRVFTKEAVAGSVLARDVYGFGDVLILKKGTVLTAENIYSLIMKNIDWIDIEEAGQEIQKVRRVLQSIRTGSKIQRNIKYSVKSIIRILASWKMELTD